MNSDKYVLQEVVTPALEREWLDLPKKIYKGNRNWVCPLDQDITEVFDPARNELFADGEAVRWVVRNKAGEVVGRIAAFYNREKAAIEEQPTGGCGFFEAIDDQQVADMMFDASRMWLASRGMEAMDGPINFGQRRDWWGLLVEGYEFQPLYKNPYNPPYYKELFENYGFKNYFNQHSFIWRVNDSEANKQIFARAERLYTVPGYRVENIDMNNLEEAAENFRVIYNKAWALFSGVQPKTREEALETTKIHSVAGNMAAGGLLARRPFRAPHHTISQAALIGGGQSPRPGEVSLAHNGVLFLDELPEFGRSVLEVLRQPLEEKKIVVSRARYSVEYPANFTLVAAMNPCPCGYYNHPARECVCSPGSVHRYMSRISGPLMDRIDMHVEVTPVSAAELSAAAPGESSAAIRARVVRAREVQAARFRCAQGVHTNAMMNAAMLREYCRPDAASAALLERAMERLNLSARAYDRILKVARTIADLADSSVIEAEHLAEALQYRSLDRAAGS